MAAAAARPKSPAATPLSSRALQGAPGRCLTARRLRMLAENDVQFLVNRIAWLKAEEQKAQRDARRTLTKAQELAAQEHRQSTEVPVRSPRASSTSAHPPAGDRALSRERHQQSVAEAREKVLREKKETVQRLRQEKEVQACQRQILLEQQRESNAKRREEIRTELLTAKVRRERALRRQQALSQRRYDERVAAEEAERVRKERQMARLLKEEEDLLHRVRVAHESRQGAVRELSRAVDALSPPAPSDTASPPPPPPAST